MKAVRRHAIAGREHEFEAERGLPEALPDDERVLWQGSPEWIELAKRVFHVHQLAVYFAALIVLRGAFAVADGVGPFAAFVSALWLVPFAAFSLGVLAFVARLSATSAVYTITNKRIVMRIGIVLTLTFNIPFKRITGAGLRLGPHGSGDVSLTLTDEDNIALLHLWPHARPWRFTKTEPMLRCIPSAADVARLLADTWSKSTGLPAAADVRIADAVAGQAQSNAPQPAMASR
jgi:hypothetical protein